MYTRILVPLDGSKLAEQVLSYVRFLGNGLSAQIELLRVIDPSFTYMAYFAHGVNPERADVLGRSHAQDYLAEVAASLRDSGLTVSSSVVSVYGKSPASEVVNTASRDCATLIAMATHGRSGLARLTLGSITEKVLRTAANPLLIVRTKDKNVFASEAKLKNVIVPVDGSLLSEQVLPHVTLLAKALGLHVILARVIFSELDYIRSIELPYKQHESLPAGGGIQGVE